MPVSAGCGGRPHRSRPPTRLRGPSTPRPWAAWWDRAGQCRRRVPRPRWGTCRRPSALGEWVRSPEGSSRRPRRSHPVEALERGARPDAALARTLPRQNRRARLPPTSDARSPAARRPATLPPITTRDRSTRRRPATLLVHPRSPFAYRQSPLVMPADLNRASVAPMTGKRVEHLAQADVRCAVQHDVCRAEAGLVRVVIRDSHTLHTRSLRRRDTVGRVLDRNGLLCGQIKSLQRQLVDGRIGLGLCYLVTAGNQLEYIERIDASKQVLHPTTRRATRHGQAKAEILTLTQPTCDAGRQPQGCLQPIAIREPPCMTGFSVVARANQFGQYRVPLIRDVAALIDRERIEIQGQAMLRVFVLPALDHGTLGIHQQTIEVEDNRLYRHSRNLVEPAREVSAW